jgi:hypothetical protein
MFSKLRSLFGWGDDSNTDSSIATVHTPTVSLEQCAEESGVYVAKRDLSGYKAVEGGIAEVTVPEGATIVSPDTRSIHNDKLRTDEFEVEMMYECSDTMGARMAAMKHRPDETIAEPMHHAGSLIAGKFDGYLYTPGRTYTEPELDKRLDRECTAGLHLFPTKERAVEFFYAHSH